MNNREYVRPIAAFFAASVLLGCLIISILISNGVSLPGPDHPPFMVGNEMKIQGEVIDGSDECYVDGLCSITVDAEYYGEVVVMLDRGWRSESCSYIGYGGGTEYIGYTVEVYAMAVDTATLDLCGSGNYYLQLKTRY